MSFVVDSFTPVKSPAELVDAFRARGLKVTPQRQLLFRLLDENDQHPTAESLFVAATAQMPGISLRTVYSTLSDLTDMGEIESLSVGAGATRFDPNTADHHHVVCDDCGEIGDVYVAGTESLSVGGLDGFTPASTSILFRGTCRSCASSSRRFNPTTSSSK